jgi:hypothetical protein
MYHGMSKINKSIRYRSCAGVLLLVLVLFFIPIKSRADWAKNFGGLNGGSVSFGKMATDSSGNIYILGSFNTNTLVLGGFTLTRISLTDVLAVKMDAAGTILWAKNFGGAGATISGRDLTADGSGNVYITGYFQTGNLTTPALTRIGSWDTFAIKLDTNGNTVWAKNFGGAAAVAYCNAVAVDGSGNVFLTGHFQTANLTTPVLTKIGTADIFVIKLDSSGNPTWAKNFGGASASAESRSIVVDSSNNIYFAGNMGTASLTTPVLTKIGATDSLVFKLDSSGNITWAKNFGGSGVSAIGYGVDVDGSGNVFINGNFQSGNLTTPALTKIGTVDSYAIKLDSSGNTTWAKNFGGAGAASNSFYMKVDGSGDVFLTGVFQSGSLTTPALSIIGNKDSFAMKLDTSGNVIWSKNYGGAGADVMCCGIAFDGTGNIYFTGGFSGGTLSNPTLALNGLADTFLMKVDSSGNTVWVNNYWGFVATGNTTITKVKKDLMGNIYVTGYFSTSFFNVGGITLTKIGFQDLFAAKLDVSGNVLWAKNFGGAAATVNGMAIAVDVSGNSFLTGYFQSGNLTTPSLTKIGTIDSFAIKLDSSGNTTWAINFGGSGASANGRAIAVDGSGNVYVSGHYQTANLTTPALTKIGNRDAYVIKLDSSGATTWFKGLSGAAANVFGNAIAVDGSGNVYVSGYFQTANLTTPSLTKIGSTDVFVVKLDSGGNTTWAKNFGGAGASGYGYDLAVDSSSNVFLVGYFMSANFTTPVLTIIGSTDIFAIKLDSSGNTIWGKNFGGSGANAYGFSTAVDKNGNAYFGGDFVTASLTSPVLNKIGSRDTFVVKLDTSGNTTWSKNYGGTGTTAYGGGLDTDGYGNIYIGGSFTNNDLTTPAVTKIGAQDSLIINTQLFKTSCTTAGKFKFDTANNVMVFCDGSLWQSMNNAPASTCTGTTTGKVQYYSNGGSSDFVWYAGTCRSAKSSTTFGACATNGKIEWDAGNSTLRGCINGTWTSFKGW